MVRRSAARVAGNRYISHIVHLRIPYLVIRQAAHLVHDSIAASDVGSPIPPDVSLVFHPQQKRYLFCGRMLSESLRDLLHYCLGRLFHISRESVSLFRLSWRAETLRRDQTRTPPPPTLRLRRTLRCLVAVRSGYHPHASGSTLPAGHVWVVCLYPRSATTTLSRGPHCMSSHLRRTHQVHRPHARRIYGKLIESTHP